MSFREIAKIAGSAMTAQTVRLNTIASNLANANTVASSENSVYQAHKPVFASVLLGEQGGGWQGAGVQVLDVVPVYAPVRKEHEPSNPLADREGYVYYSNINQVEEMTDMMSSSSAFQTNADVLIKVGNMQNKLLELGDL